MVGEMEKKDYLKSWNYFKCKSRYIKKSYRSDINIVSYCNEFFSAISRRDNWAFKPSEINSKNQGYVKAICMSDLDKEANIYSVLLEELKAFEPYDNVAIIAKN